MILDATAANRTIWRSKQHENIVYLDMEKKLELKPTIYADNTNSPFLDKTFNEVFYDPPHAYGVHTGRHVFPSKQAASDIGVDPDSVSIYYGWDKYKNQSELIHHVYNAQKEFQRILKDDGLLFLKWNEVCIGIGTIMSLFDDWKELMRILVDSKAHPAGTRNTYWIMMAKNIKKEVQATL